MQQKIFKAVLSLDGFEILFFSEPINVEDPKNMPLKLEELNNSGYSIVQIIQFKTDQILAICNFNSSNKKLGAAGL